MKTVDFAQNWHRLALPEQVKAVLENAKGLIFPESRDEIFALAMGNDPEAERYEVCYEVPGKGDVHEATVVRCRNGLSINYTEAYMRRRDPDCMVVADDKPSDKPRYVDRYGQGFDELRDETFTWLCKQELVVMPFMLGGFPPESGRGALLIAPANAGFFVGGLADLQGMLPASGVPEDFNVRSVVYLAPPYRHTHFDGRQVVVHNRLDEVYEIFSYNLYPGPSAKKGIYGVLLDLGMEEDWPTLHGSTVQVVTPYDNVTTIMHEGASGSGKSEMLQHPHRQEDGRLLLGQNIVTDEQLLIVLNQACQLCPVTDDMAISHVGHGDESEGYLGVSDAEQAWFVRLDHIDHYGVDPHLERVTIHSSEPILFLNVYGAPNSTCLIWEHTEDEPGVPCPNPRIILPRRLDPNVVDGIVEVHLRNFGIRTPPCTAERPSYGIIGYMHILPPALAWLWRLVAPRGHANPSITETQGMSSEGVGSYWPFASGRRVDHANLLLKQMEDSHKVRYSLTPNQHVGAWAVSFMPQWVAREYLARRGSARFRDRQLIPARCPLLGYALENIQVEGSLLPDGFLRVEEQPEVGKEGYDEGARILGDFFKKELLNFDHPDLSELGRRIIECCKDDGALEDYEKLLPGIDTSDKRKGQQWRQPSGM